MRVLCKDEIRRGQHGFQMRTLGQGFKLEVLLQGAGSRDHVVLCHKPESAFFGERCQSFVGLRRPDLCGTGHDLHNLMEQRRGV